MPSRSIERNEPDAEPEAEPLPEAPVLLDGLVLLDEPDEDGEEPDAPLEDDGEDDEPLLIEPDDPEAPVSDELEVLLLPPAIATPETAERAKAKSTALLRNFMRGLLAKLNETAFVEQTVCSCTGLIAMRVPKFFRTRIAIFLHA